jgi:glycosyltransferase involved in cell wall biosynthesis
MNRRTESGEPGNTRGLKICVDFPWDASACMGTGAYSESMVRALAEAAPDAKIMLIVPLGSPRRIQLANVSYRSLPATEGLAEGTRQIALPSFLAAVGADCLFSPATLLPAVKVCPMVATVHDLAFETHAETYAPGLSAYLRRWIPSTLEGADRIVAISEPVKQDLLFRKRIHPSRVSVIEQPIRDTFLEPLPDEEALAELAALGASPPYFFHVSNLGVHKNMEFGVRVMAEYLKRNPESKAELLFAGGGFAPSAPPDLLAAARSLGIGDRVRYVGKVQDRALKALYQKCEAFLFPSLTEGWGLPVVEARALGAEVLASPHVPSARGEERISLETEDWVDALERSERGDVGGPPTSSEEAGRHLWSVLRDAMESYRRERPSHNASEAASAEPGGDSDRTLIAIRGDWHSPSGFGQAARGVASALEKAGLKPVAVAVPKDAIQDKRLWKGEVSLWRDSADLWVHHVPPEYFDCALPGKHASFFFWETDRLPESVAGCEWRKALSGLDEIWAPSRFIADVLETSGVKAPVAQIFPPVDSELYSPGPRRAPGIELPSGFDPSWSVFLYVGTWDPRKRPDILVRCFSRAFTRKDNALLILKTYVTGDASRDREILGQWVSQSRLSDAHVRFIPEVLSTSEMAELFRFSTAFATASRGEGYCLPAVQAMSSAKPVVASSWSSFRDFVTVPVKYRLEGVPREVALPGYSPDQRWAVVSEEDLARNLRRLHEDREEGRRLGQVGRDWVQTNASMEIVGKRIRERAEALCGKNGRTNVLEVAR